MFTSWHTKRFEKSLPWKILFTVVGVLISISTMFIKQHSAIDIACAVLLCGIFYPVMQINYKDAAPL